MRKVWFCDPAGTRSSPGNSAAPSGSLLVIRTTPSGCAGHIAAGIGPLKVSVPPELPPPAIDAGEIVIDRSLGRRFGGRTKNGRFQVEPPLRAAMPTSMSVNGGLVVSGKLAVSEPAATVTLDGTCAIAGWELESATGVPPAGAG